MPGTNLYWVGGAPAVAQVVDCTVGGTIASGETFSISINGEEIVSYTTTGGDTASEIVAALVSDWNASTSPYASGIVAASDEDPAVRLTSSVEGMPFDEGSNGVSVSTDSASGTFSKSEVTANAGPNVFDDDNNWSTGTAPASSDRVVIDDPGARILWGLDQSALVGVVLVLRDFSVLGLRGDVFSTNNVGGYSNSREEYRPQYLNIGFNDCYVGHSGSPSIARCKLDLIETTTPHTIRVINAGTSTDPGQPTVRLRSDAVQKHDVIVDDGDLGFATEDHFSEFNGGDLIVHGGTVDVRGNYAGTGVEFDELISNGGTTYVNGAPSASTGIDKVTVNSGGVLYWNQLYNPGNGATVNYGGKLVDSTVGGTISTVAINRGGEIDARKTSGRTYTTVTLEQGTKLRRPHDLTISTLNMPTDKPYTLELS